MDTEKVVLEEIVDSAQRVVIRFNLDNFQIMGPRRNIFTVESLVAFSTVVNELYKEGYQMVSPEQYAEEYGLSVESVYSKIGEEGSLFLLSYPGTEPPSRAVPLEEVMESDQGPHLPMT